MRGACRAFIIFRNHFRLYILRCSAEFPAHRLFAHGNKFGILQANIEVGLKHPETREELKAYLKKLAADLD